MRRYLPWLLAAFISLLGFYNEFIISIDKPLEIDYISGFLYVLGITFFAFIGALIVDRQGGNRVGWLMMITAIVIANPTLEFIPQEPPQGTPLTLGLWLAIWVNNWVTPVGLVSASLILLHFPDGRPPSPRWNWINAVALVTILLAALLPLLADQIGSLNYGWNLDNPLGIFPKRQVEYSYISWIIGLLIVGGASLASLFYRFRWASYTERQQIKWLLYAGAMPLIAIGLLFLLPALSIDPYTAGWPFLLASIWMMFFPLAIGNAILRYRLYEIDIIIRRTLQYTLVSGTLVLLYFLGVLILQGILNPLTGETNSPLVIVVTTLGIAALFNPLRRRVQGFIDRRFYRARYDADQTLVSFATTARDEVDIERLADTLLGVVEETMQPDHLSLWLKEEHRENEPASFAANSIKDRSL